MNPPTNAVVFSVDEKSQIQALERAQPILPMDIGQPERRTHNYIRNATLDLFAALNVGHTLWNPSGIALTAIGPSLSALSMYPEPPRAGVTLIVIRQRLALPFEVARA